MYDVTIIGAGVTGCAIANERVRMESIWRIRLIIPAILLMGFFFLRNFSLKVQRNVDEIVCSVYCVLII